jgi:sugar lactone lactonase YvrE
MRAAFAALALSCFASAAAAQETWAPVVMLDGTTITLNGVAQPVVNGPVPAVDQVVPGLPANPPISYPNGFCENPITHEWIIADTYHSRLLRFAADDNPNYAAGTYLGALVTGTGLYTSAPYGPVVDDDGTIIVPDYYANNLKLFVPVGASYQEHTVTTFRNDVSGDPADTFDLPIRVALAPDAQGHMSVASGQGVVWLLDQENNRVVKLQPGGTVAAPDWSAAVVFGNDASVAGSGPGNFYYPTGLAVDAAGNVYVSDPNNTTLITIQVFDPTGAPLQTISQGLSAPWALAISPVTQRLFVTDTGNNRIAVFEPYNAANPATSLAPATVRIGTASQPLGGINLPSGIPNDAGAIGELQEPAGIAFDARGRLLVADTDDFRIQIFDRARLITAAVAVPQTLTATDSAVVVRVRVSSAPGESATLTAVHPEVPVVSFAQGGGPGTPVVDTTPSCVTTPSSPSSCLGDLSSLTAGETLSPNGQLDYTFTFDRLPGAVGPVWFSVHATGMDGLNPLASATAQTYAIAVGGDTFGAPQISATVTDALGGTAASGWYATQPVNVNLSALVPNPGAGLDPASGDGQVQEIEYNLGPIEPTEGDFYVCFNFYTAGTGDASCTVPIYKEGVTKVWYRALSTRGLYDHLEPYSGDASVSVPGWTSIDVQIDLNPPTVAVFQALDSNNAPAPGHNTWYRVSPLTVPFRVSDLGSGIDTVSITSAAPGFTSSLNPLTDPSFQNGTLGYSGEGLYNATITAVDRAGNQNDFTYPTGIDMTPPVPGAAGAPTSATTLASRGGATWSRSPISVTWSATDALSGFDSAATHTTSCTSSVSTGVGQNLSCTFQDFAGNTAVTTPAGPFSIDTTAPLVTTTFSPAALIVSNHTWFRTAPASVTFDLDDQNGAGFSNGQVTDSVTVASPASGSVQTFADVVGNQTTVTVGPFSLDNVAPDVSVSAPAAAATVGTTKWYGGPVTVTFNANDHGGVGLPDPNDPLGSVQTETRTGTSTGTAISETFTDLLGNAATATGGPFNIDAAAPVVASAITFANASPATGIVLGGTTWFPAPVRVTFTATDAGAGFSTSAQVLSATQAVDVTSGTTLVTSQAFTDVLGHSASLTVGPLGIDTIAPAMAAPANIVAAASPTGATAVVTYTVPTATDNVDPSPGVSCSPASGSTFPMGATTVSCTATDEVGNTTTQTFTVTVEDHTAPVLTTPASPYSVPATGTGPSTVTFTVTAVDNVDANPTIACTPASGTLFQIGQTTVSCTATDAAGNSSTVEFDVILSTEPPVVTVPANIVAEATGSGGATVAFTASATDAVDGALPVTCTPASNGLFPLGPTSVSCTATNSAGRSTSESFTVTVVDTTPPTLVAPPGATGIATSPTGAIVPFVVDATDLVDGTVPVVCVPPSGSMFPIGGTIVVCTATDHAGNQASVSFPVVVQPSTPICTTAVATPDVLWPPNHMLVPVGITGVTSPDGSALGLVITGIYQDEPTNGLGDGDTPIDAGGLGTGTALLRAERAGSGDGRVYHIVFTATSQYGTSCTGEVRAGVPHDAAHPAIDNGALFNSIVPSSPEHGDDDHDHSGDRDHHDGDKDHHDGDKDHHDGDRDHKGDKDHHGDDDHHDGDHDQQCGGHHDNGVNHAPAITTALADRSNTAGETVSLPVAATDEDGDPLTFAANGLPAGLSINTATGLISGTPTAAGTSSVTITATDPHGKSATASFTWTINAAHSPAGAARILHAPVLNGGSVLTGSLQVMAPESITFNGAAKITGDLFVPGMPAVQTNGTPAYFGGTADGTGAETPNNFRITLNGGTYLGHLVRRTDASALPVVAPPPAPAGTRSVSLNNSSTDPGSYATLRNLTLNGSVGAVAVPAGAYGSFTANGNNSFVLGVAGSSTPAVYSFQSLTLNGTSQIAVVGPVVITLGTSLSLSGSIGNAAHPEWTTLAIASGGLTLNGSVSVYGFVVAPTGTITINGGTQLVGNIAAGGLTLNSSGILTLIAQ